jgi:signal transduction histidine kinase
MSGPDNLKAVAELAGKVANQRTVVGACDEALRVGMTLSRARCAEVLFRDAENHDLVCLANRGAYPWCAGQADGRRLGSRLVEKTLQTQLPLCVSDVGADQTLEFDLPAGAETMRATSLPLVVRGRVLGAVNFCGPEPADLPADTEAALSLIAGLLAPVIENLYISERATSKEIERRQFLMRELEAGEDERRRIARELHDSLGQTLTGLAMSIDAALAMLSHPGKETAATAVLQRSSDAASTAIHDVRRVILALRPTALDDMGLFAALEGYGRRVLSEAGIALRVRSTGQSFRLSPAIENVVFRVMQEAINNVARHSHARTCRLLLASTGKTLRACVQDDGVGFDFAAVADNGHVGLKSMKERVEVVGGQLLIESQPGSGCRVEVRVSSRGKNAASNTNRDR